MIDFIFLVKLEDNANVSCVSFTDQTLTLFLNGGQVGVTNSVPYLNFVSNLET